MSPDLVGYLGLPGAVASLLASFFFGVATYQKLRNGKHSSDLTFKDLMAARDAIVSDSSKTRHHLDNKLTIFGGGLEDSVKENFKEILAKLDSIERAIRDNR